MRVRRLLIALLSVVLSLVLVEGIVRAYFATQVGPRILLYGTPWHRYETEAKVAKSPTWQESVQEHRNYVGDYQMYSVERSHGYSKYFPNETKVTYSPDGRVPYQVRINNQGFRGRDFEVKKAPGAIRVLTMGASSTFGYRNRDDETYPYQLEQILNRDGGGRHFEVINFAIPHATSDNLLAMFLAEGIPLEPDFVTFYEGANDAAIVSPPQGALAQLYRALSHRLLTVEFLGQMTAFEFGSAVHPWSEKLATERSQIFLENVAAIQKECRKRGIQFIVATQQFKSELIPREKMKGVTYVEELEIVRQATARGEAGPGKGGLALTPMEQLARALDAARVLPIHARLMADLEAWAAANGIELVDVRAALDQHRDLLVSWVHLYPEGNRIIAEALAQQILADVRDEEPEMPPAGVAAQPPTAG